MREELWAARDERTWSWSLDKDSNDTQTLRSNETKEMQEKYRVPDQGHVQELQQRMFKNSKYATP